MPPTRKDAPSQRPNYIYEQLYDLRRGKSGDHERPHKPALLLALVDLIDSGHFAENRFPLDDAWRNRFNAYFERVAAQDDRPNIHLPYYHLKSDGFWHLATADGAAPDRLPAPSSFAQARSLFPSVSFDDTLWQEVSTPAGRHRLRQALIARYFPHLADQLAKLSPAAHDTPEHVAAEDADPYGEQEATPRSAAFRSLVTRLYDHQCVACGLRIRLDATVTFVDAAHIIPFAVSRNDHPSNGLALCKNHHWAMDQNLIALDTSLRWRISPRIDPRRSTGESDLYQLRHQPLLNQPSEPDFHPAPAAIQWRLKRLLGA